jgi:ubiquinone biosynthesis protein
MPSLLSAVRDLDRMRQITLVLARHGFGEVVHRIGLGSLTTAPPPAGAAQAPRELRSSLASRLRRVLEDLGPSFIKLGQIASTRPDVFPEDIIAELKRLQEHTTPLPFEVLRGEVEEQLGPLAEVFTSFDEQPLASASIAQVHRATLLDEGAAVDVVVKIQRPGVRSVIEKDIDLLYLLAHAIERSLPESRTYNPVALVTEFDRCIHAELDFVREAEHAERFAENFANVAHVRFARIYKQASTHKVLTMQYLNGKSLYEAIAAGHRGPVIAKRAVGIVIKQIFEDGFFHADPHPGNILISGSVDEPVIAMIDVGLVGRLTPRLRDRTIDLMVAATMQDHRGIADAIYAIGRTSAKIDRDRFESEVAMLSDRYLKRSLREVQLAMLVRDLIGCATRHGLQIPPDFLMVGKALMTVEGIGREIDPDLDILQEAKPYFLELVRQRYAPDRLKQDALRTLLRLSDAVSEAPFHANEILDDLRQGNLTLKLSQRSLVRATDELGRRVLGGFTIAALIVAAAMLYDSHPVASAIALAASAAQLLMHGLRPRRGSST